MDKIAMTRIPGVKSRDPRHAADLDGTVPPFNDNAHCMQIRIHAPGRHLLLSLFDVERALASGDIEPGETRYWDDCSAHDFFRQHFSEADALRALRQALLPWAHDLTRMSDDDVRAAAARQLRDGAWRLGYEYPRQTSTSGGAATRATERPPAPARRRVEAPPAPRAAAPVRTVPPPAAAVSAPSSAEWTESIDQAAFAGVLERAAKDAAPFCEVCARLAAQREAVST